MCVCRTKNFGNSGNGVDLVAIFMSLRGLTKLKILRGQYMIFTYENRHQASFKGCFSAFSNFVPASLCRLPVLGGREPYAHAGTCLGLLVCVAYSHPQLFSAIRNTDSHRDYSINKMDFTSMPAHGNLAIGSFFCIGPQICIFAWSGYLGQTEASQCLNSQTSKPVQPVWNPGTKETARRRFS